MFANPISHYGHILGCWKYHWGEHLPQHQRVLRGTVYVAFLGIGNRCAHCIYAGQGVLNGRILRDIGQDIGLQFA